MFVNLSKQKNISSFHAYARKNNMWILDLNQLLAPSWESSICRRIDRVTIPSESLPLLYPSSPPCSCTVSKRLLAMQLRLPPSLLLTSTLFFCYFFCSTPRYSLPNASPHLTPRYSLPRAVGARSAPVADATAVHGSGSLQRQQAAEAMLAPRRSNRIF